MNTLTEANELASILSARRMRVVFAESCTGGLVSAQLAAIPGISEFLCGSLVTYRSECKRDWLAISANTLRRYTAVSSEVTERMSIEALRRTPTADLAAAVTGYLGPDAPPEHDGRVYVAVARRMNGEVQVVHSTDGQMNEAPRVARQLEATRRVLRSVIDRLSAE